MKGSSPNPETTPLARPIITEGDNPLLSDEYWQWIVQEDKAGRRRRIPNVSVGGAGPARLLVVELFND